MLNNICMIPPFVDWKLLLDNGRLQRNIRMACDLIEIMRAQSMNLFFIVIRNFSFKTYMRGHRCHYMAQWLLSAPSSATRYQQRRILQLHAHKNETHLHDGKHFLFYFLLDQTQGLPCKMLGRCSKNVRQSEHTNSFTFTSQRLEYICTMVDRTSGISALTK